MKPSTEVPSYTEGSVESQSPGHETHNEIKKLFTPARIIMAAYLAIGAVGAGAGAYITHERHRVIEAKLVTLIGAAELTGDDELAKNLRELASKEGFEVDPRHILEIPID